MPKGDLQPLSMAPRVGIRVDASAHMGTGHLKRCLSLAEALRSAGADVNLVVRAIDPVAMQLLRDTAWSVQWLHPPSQSEGQPWQHLPEDPPHASWAAVPWKQDALETVAVCQHEPPAWLVIDHYAFDARWHHLVSQALGCRLLVIDDTADRTIDADLLLDPNWATDHAAKYAGRLMREPRLLGGPRFALLNSVYQDAPKHQVNPEVRSLGIFMGGADPNGVSARVLAACRATGFTGEIEVVSTSANPHLATLRDICASLPPSQITVDAPDLSAFFARHDLQIGAGGGATWERCCIGAPTIALALADNQNAVIPGLASLGAVRAARLPGTAATPAAPLDVVLKELLQDAPARARLAERAVALVDGRGAQRVALALLSQTLQVRPATAQDAERLHRWRNHPEVRRASFKGDAIPWHEHLAWMERVLATPERHLLVGQVGVLPVGSMRFDALVSGELEVSLYLDPDLQGLGLGQQLLLAGERAMARQLERGFNVQAAVLADNLPSRRLFEACGYHGGPLQYAKSVEYLPSL